MMLHSRRRRASQLAGVGLATTLILTACAGGSGNSESDDAESTGSESSGEETAQTESESPFGAPADEPLEVYLFDGGYGTEYAQGFVDVYNRTLPGSEVEVKATQEISTQLQPRFVAGDPPDVIDNSGQPVDGKTLLEDGQLYDLQVLLDAPSLDDPSMTVADTLTDGVVEAGSFGGQFVQLPYVNTVMGMWYSASLFEERGWEVPTTWEDFIALGEEVKEEGISLFAYPGQAPSYAATFWMALAIKEGGEELMLNIDNLQPDAWRDPAVEGAFEAMVELSDKGLILEGSEALSHTEAQTEFVLGKALFYPCGSWLEERDGEHHARGLRDVGGSDSAADRERRDGCQRDPGLAAGELHRAVPVEQPRGWCGVPALHADQGSRSELLPAHRGSHRGQGRARGRGCDPGSGLGDRRDRERLAHRHQPHAAQLVLRPAQALGCCHCRDAGWAHERCRRGGGSPGCRRWRRGR